VAQLDALLKALVDRGATELVLNDGQQPAFRFGEELRPISPRVLSQAQISLLVTELADPMPASRITAGQPASFVYRSDGRPFLCEVGNVSGGFCARLTPQPDEAAPTASAQEADTENAAITDTARAVTPAATPATSPAEASVDKSEVERYLRKMVELGASDLHLCAGEVPMVRVSGDMVRMEGEEPLAAERTRELLTAIMPDRNRQEYLETNDTDFAHEIAGLSRFRANVFTDRKGASGVFRTIPTQILTAEQLGLSKAILELCMLPKGLVLVTGPTGSGKSTTLAAMVDHINRTRTDHIITIEDPIEFVHPNLKCLVNQREVVTHTDGFKKALRAALREDPDIVLVGEMRDLETIAIAIETAETGHLVFGTLHTTTACSTVDRIIDQFPSDRQAQIRTMLSESLKGVVSQTLVKKIGGGRVAGLEVLLVTPAISNLIREGKTFQIPSLMQTGKRAGMVLLNDALLELVKKKLVEPEEAFRKAIDKSGFAKLLANAGVRLKAQVES
jgi:twitching motility protein PilT